MSMEQYKQTSHQNVATPLGFYTGGMHCGLKYKRSDFGMIYSDVPASVAGMFTTNALQAAPLQVTKQVVYKTKYMQGIIVNSANANACTGKQGIENAKEMQRLMAERFDIDPSLVGVASTGVIGEQLRMEPIYKGVEELRLGRTQQHAIEFSQAILTTDTITKTASYQIPIDGKTVTISGAAKGSGMIEPNMATMLAFITTDAQIDPTTLQKALRIVTDQTFNCITVDGDTSTNDTVLVLANGLAGNDSLTEEHPDWSLFLSALRAISEDLAKMIAKDGEGATKLIEVNVKEASSVKEARQVAKTVVGSPLVKTAMFGKDGNWGRIIAAVGYSGVSLNMQRVKITIGDIVVLEDGEPKDYDEDALQMILEEPNIFIDIELGNGRSSGTAWGCDLTYEYININASYRS